MFEHFTIKYNSKISSAYLEAVGISAGEIEQLFYLDYHVVHVGTRDYFIIGFTGLRMLIVDFELNYEENLIKVEEIYIPNGEDIKEKYCRHCFK